MLLKLDTDGVAWLGPARALPQRYHRVQDLAVDRLDPIGGNLAMVLRSLTSDELGELSGWLHEHMGFRLELRTEGAHVQVLVNDGRASDVLTDTGFGLSQVLPVAVQLWLLLRGSVPRGRRPIHTVVIEQPELHLHPAQQARLGFLLAAVAAEAVRQKEGRKLIVETHSETVIQTVGEAIELGQIAPEDVNVVLFERDAAGDSTVRTAHYDATGQLIDWPAGFLSR